MKIVKIKVADQPAFFKSRFEAAKRKRAPLEEQWRENYKLLFTSKADEYLAADSPSSTNILTVLSQEEISPTSSRNAEVLMNWVYKNARTLHSQFTANVPSVTLKPTSPEASDVQSTAAVERVLEYAKRRTEIMRHIGLMVWDALWSIGWVKVYPDEYAGDLIADGDNYRTTGDVVSRQVDPFKIWVDPVATTLTGARFFIEEVEYELDEAIARYPDAEAELREAATSIAERDEFFMPEERENDYHVQTKRVLLYEYWERRHVTNGYHGRHGVFLEDGVVIQTLDKSPIKGGRVPYEGLYLVDAPQSPYGIPIVSYARDAQDALIRMDSSILDAIKDSIHVSFLTPNNSLSYNETAGNKTYVYTGEKPTPLQPPVLPPDIWRLRQYYIDYIQDIFGLNDAMQGIVRRETSAVSQQTAILAGQNLHRWYAEKYAKSVERIWDLYIIGVQQTWTEARLTVLFGLGSVWDAKAIKGADIEGGYAFLVDQGAALPLDPNARRETITILQPLLREAGFTPQQIIQYMRINDLEGVYDKNELGKKRQSNIFRAMVDSVVREGVPIYIRPDSIEDHAAMLSWASYYVMTEEYAALPEAAQVLIKQHIEERKQMAMQGQAAPMGLAQAGVEQPLAEVGAETRLTEIGVI